MVQLITLSTPTRVEVELGYGCGWAVTIAKLGSETKRSPTIQFGNNKIGVSTKVLVGPHSANIKVFKIPKYPLLETQENITKGSLPFSK